MRYRLELKEEAREQLRALPRVLFTLEGDLERIEDLEDLMELRAAVERNEGKPGILWEKVKGELELD